MWDFDLIAATRTLEKSMPFVLYRVLLCLGVGFGFLFSTLVGAGTLIAFASLSKNASALGPVGAMLGFLGFAYLCFRLRVFWLRHAQLPQLGLLAELSKSNDLPAGAAQIDYAKRLTAKAFPSTSALARLDRLARMTLGDMIQGPVTEKLAGVPRLVRSGAWVARRLFARNDRTLLAWFLRTGTGSIAASLRQGLPIFWRHLPLLLRNRGYAFAFEWLGFAAVYPLLVIGFSDLVTGLPVDLGFWVHLFALVFAWVFKAGFLEPIAEAAMMQVYFPRAAEGPDPEAVQHLATVSASFEELTGWSSRHDERDQH